MICRQKFFCPKKRRNHLHNCPGQRFWKQWHQSVLAFLGQAGISCCCCVAVSEPKPLQKRAPLGWVNWTYARNHKPTLQARAQSDLALKLASYICVELFSLRSLCILSDIQTARSRSTQQRVKSGRVAEHGKWLKLAQLFVSACMSVILTRMLCDALINSWCHFGSNMRNIILYFTLQRKFRHTIERHILLSRSAKSHFKSPQQIWGGVVYVVQKSASIQGGQTEYAACYSLTKNFLRHCHSGTKFCPDHALVSIGSVHTSFIFVLRQGQTVFVLVRFLFQRKTFSGVVCARMPCSLQNLPDILSIFVCGWNSGRKFSAGQADSPALSLFGMPFFRNIFGCALLLMLEHHTDGEVHPSCSILRPSTWICTHASFAAIGVASSRSECETCEGQSHYGSVIHNDCCFYFAEKSRYVCSHRKEKRHKNSQVQQTRNVDVRVSVHVVFHPLGTNTPQKHQHKVVSQSPEKEWKVSLVKLLMRKATNVVEIVFRCFCHSKRTNSCLHVLYVYVDAYVYVSWWPNLAHEWDLYTRLWAASRDWHCVSVRCEGCCHQFLELNPTNMAAKRTNQSRCLPVHKRQRRTILWCCECSELFWKWRACAKDIRQKSEIHPIFYRRESQIIQACCRLEVSWVALHVQLFLFRGHNMYVSHNGRVAGTFLLCELKRPEKKWPETRSGK